jgi:beta-aspartyl-peptidase (threonine type)
LVFIKSFRKSRLKRSDKDHEELNMKKSLLALFFISFMLLLSSLAQTRAEDEILNLLEKQKEAWNRGDLNGYMAYYWNSEDLTFQSGDRRVKGWQALYDRYSRSYTRDKMGHLQFSDLEIRLLGKGLALVLGRWQVEAQAEKKGGVFTLVLKKFPEGWRIIHDHTS